MTHLRAAGSVVCYPTLDFGSLPDPRRKFDCGDVLRRYVRRDVPAASQVFSKGDREPSK